HPVPGHLGDGGGHSDSDVGEDGEADEHSSESLHVSPFARSPAGSGVNLRQRAKPWYSRLGIMPVAIARRLVKLYIAATSMTSQMSASESPSARRASMSDSSQAPGSLVTFTA